MSESFTRKSIKKQSFRFSDSLRVDILNGDKTQKSHVEFKHQWEDISADIAKILCSLCRHSIDSKMEISLILENTLNKIITLTRSELGNISILDETKENGKHLKCLALGETITGTILPGKYSNQQKSVESLVGYPIRTGHVIIISDYSSVHSKYCTPENHPVIKSFISLPLFFQKTPMGVLTLANAVCYGVETVKKLMPILNCIEALVKKHLDHKETLVDSIKRTSEVDEVKDKFLATISHELRTPLNGIMGMTTMLGDVGPLNKKQREYIQNLTECSIQLTNLLNNILDFSKMAADRLSLQKQPMEIHSTVLDCVKMFEENIKAKGLEFNVKIQKDIPVLIGDSQRLIQILQNLLSNAYKFTDKGYITLDVEGFYISSQKGAEKWKVIFNITDTEVGIPEEEQEKIFETFHQVSSISTYASNNGTGLGLSIARELVRLMDGKISLTSKLGEGSTFSFYIILSKNISVDNMSRLNQSTLKDKKVLIIDDRPEMRLQLADMMFRWHCIPHTVTSAEEALQCLRYGMKFDIALVDICMPGMSGIELAQELCQSFPELPLIGISSAELTSGTDYFHRYMYKPIDQGELSSALIECLQVKKTKKKKKRRKNRKNLRILIAEDDTHNIYTLKEMLIHLGFRKQNIKVAQDGNECVRMVKKTIKPYDVILMDIKMPKMDGLEATKIIKKKFPDLFILAVSAAVQPAEKAKGQKAGIDGYLSKPLLKNKLEAALLPLVKDKKIG